MSAVPASIDRDLVATRTGAYGAKARGATRERSRASDAVALVLIRTVMLTGVAGTAYLASSLAGNVNLEIARRDNIRFTDRATAARAGEGALRSAVENLRSRDVIDSWAKYNGFVPAYVPAPPQKS